MKTNLEFYRHYTDSHTHPKFKMLRVKYGWAGEGKFWALNNIIARSSNCILDLNENYNRAAVACDLDFTLDEFDSFISYLANDCKLIQDNKGLITTHITQENLCFVSQDREAARRRYEAAKKRKETDVTGFIGEEFETSGEVYETSGEKIYKENKTKVKNDNIYSIKEMTEEERAELQALYDKRSQALKGNNDGIEKGTSLSFLSGN